MPISRILPIFDRNYLIVIHQRMLLMMIDYTCCRVVAIVVVDFTSMIDVEARQYDDLNGGCIRC